MEAIAIHALAVIIGIFLIVYFFWEGFETVVLPRTVTTGWRFTRAFYSVLWRRVWQPIGRRFNDFRRSDVFLGIYGPISLLLLLQFWALALIIGYAVIQWGLNVPLRGMEAKSGIGAYLYFSGVTFLTLGYGDITPVNGIGRAVAVLEAGTGFGFLATIIGYIPVLYGAFSMRESSVTLIDARAGSPPSSLEMLRRFAVNGAINDIHSLLKDMERWISELLESQLSHPILSFYRSQHDDQSWISALIVIMDSCAIIMTGLEGVSAWQAQLTFAIGRHALVDLCLIFNQAPAKRYLSRLTEPDMERIASVLRESGITFQDADHASAKLTKLRGMYEPYAVALARLLSFSLPPFVPAQEASDDWQRSAWERVEHF